MVLNQYVHFWDGSSLKIRMTVNRDLELAKYGFHYMDANGEMIWRKDQHDDPAGTHGGEYHIHDTPNLPNKARAYPAVDLEEALQEVVDEVDTTQIEPQ